MRVGSQVPVIRGRCAVGGLSRPGGGTGSRGCHVWSRVPGCVVLVFPGPVPTPYPGLPPPPNVLQTTEVHSVVAVLCCADVDAAGRLPYTIFPASYVDEVPLTDMGMRPNTTSGNPGHTYRFYTGEVVYPFGYGLR